MAKAGSVKRKHRKHNLKRYYNMSIEAYDAMLFSQGKRCAICAFKPKEHERQLSVDHCHKTLKIRGLICHWCNTGLGRFKDNVNVLLAAIDYLRNHPDYGKVIKTRLK